MRRFLTVLMVLLVIGATVPAPAAAQSTEDCSTFDAFLWVMTQPVGWLADHCDPVMLSDDVQDLESDLANSTEVSIYNTGQQSVAATNQLTTVMQNSLNSSRTVAMSHAEAAAISAIDNGSSRSEVKTAASDAVKDYYATKQINLADRYSVHTSTVNTMISAAHTASGVSNSFVDVESVDDIQGDREADGHDDTSTVTLVDGSSYQFTQIGYDDDTSGQGGWGSPASDDYGNTDDGRYFVVGSITGETSYNVFDAAQYGDLWGDIESQSTQMESNAEVYADGLYNMSQNGTLESTSYVSPSTLAQEYSTDYNSTGYYSYAVAYAGAAGFAIPDMNVSATMTIQTGSGTYEGLIMSQYAPDNGTWVVDRTYDASLIQGKQFVARTDGNITELTGQFTITEMLDESGTPVVNTTVQQIEYSTSNVSENFTALQQEIRALQQEILEDEEGGLSGPGGAGGGLGNLGLLGIGVLVLLVGGAMLTKSGSGRRRRR